MKIIVLSVGRIKEKFYCDAIDAYTKSISKHADFECIEVADEKTPDQSSEKEDLQIKEREGERLLAKIKPETYLIALAIDGKKITSAEFARHLDHLRQLEKNHITFVIGGSLGLSDRVLARAQYKLSFSPMTFPHQLMKVILLEQLCHVISMNHIR